MGRRGGFSLIELLIASVVAASAAVLLSGGLISANRSASMRAEGIVLEQLLADRWGRLEDPLPSAQPQQGACPAPFDDATWTLAVEPLEGPLASVAYATLTVERNGHAVSLATYRAIAQQP